MSPSLYRLSYADILVSLVATLLRGVESNDRLKVMSLTRYHFSTPLYNKTLLQSLRAIVLDFTNFAIITSVLKNALKYSTISTVTLHRAVIAQVVEHIHGKNEVISASLINGSKLECHPSSVGRAHPS